MTSMQRLALSCAIAATLAASAPATAPAAGRCGEPTQRPWCNTNLGPDERADLLLAALAPDERVSLLAGDDPFGAGGGEHAHTGTSAGIDRAGLSPTYYWDTATGAWHVTPGRYGIMVRSPSRDLPPRGSTCRGSVPRASAAMRGANCITEGHEGGGGRSACGSAGAHGDRLSALLAPGKQT